MRVLDSISSKKLKNPVIENNDNPLQTSSVRQPPPRLYFLPVACCKLFRLTPSYSVINNYLNTEFQPQQGDVERSEDALSAMSVAALDDSIGWADTTINSWTRRFTVHVILVVTDALFQYTAPAIPKLAAAPGSPCVGHAPRSGSTFSVNYKCTDDVGLYYID